MAATTYSNYTTPIFKGGDGYNYHYTYFPPTYSIDFEYKFFQGEPDIEYDDEGTPIGPIQSTYKACHYCYQLDENLLVYTLLDNNSWGWICADGCPQSETILKTCNTCGAKYPVWEFHVCTFRWQDNELKTCSKCGILYVKHHTCRGSYNWYYKQPKDWRKNP